MKLSSVCALYDQNAANPACDSEVGDYTHCVTVCDNDKSDAICQ